MNVFSGLVKRGDFSTWTARDYDLGALVAAPTKKLVAQISNCGFVAQRCIKSSIDLIGAATDVPKMESRAVQVLKSPRKTNPENMFK